jgi:5-methylcytosine-specific restriction enzyme subunit McrC
MKFFRSWISPDRHLGETAFEHATTCRGTRSGGDRCPETRERLEEFAKKTKDKNNAHRVLGLHMDPGAAAPGVWWFVGQVWLPLREEPRALSVLPKLPHLTPVQMYAECMTDPVVRSHLDQCIYFYWDGRPIPVEDWDHRITLLVVMRYLCLVHELCQKHLRLIITPVEENLTGRIKGRPLVQSTMRMNHARGRLDRTYCRFQMQSIDTVPNQILAAAFHQAVKHLQLNPALYRALSHIATFSANALSGVTLRRILPTDFQGLHYGGFLRPYREPHRWARLVLRLLGPDPLEEISGVRETALPPFAIDMKELFERYCEVKLRRVSSQNVWAGYKDRNRNLGSRLQVRPDFLVRAGKTRWVVDAKYKADWSWKENEQQDVYQVVSYCAHKGVLRELGFGSEPDERPTAVILYPASPGDQVADQERDLDLNASANEFDVLHDFEVDVLWIPVILPYAEAVALASTLVVEFSGGSAVSDCGAVEVAIGPVG